VVAAAFSAIAATAAEAGVATGAIQYAWVIALLPFIAAPLILFFGKRTPGQGAVFGVAALGAGFVMALAVLFHFVTGGGTYAPDGIEWFEIGPLHLEVGQYVDGLTAVMLVVVTAVSLAVHVYSLGYMHGDVRFTWFYVVLSLFTGAMLTVVIADNLLMLLVGWEIMGVCSYLLIGHWYEEHENSSAAIKAFITTRIGDVPFMFGIFALIFATGFTTTNIAEIGEAIAGPGTSPALVTAAALLLFGGAIGKSAQFPLHVWLPDAMAGPTPVSALIHAATMVAAGVYLVGRMFEVFVHADPFVLTIVSVIAAITTLGAAFLALVQDDIKRVLAYSTLSQLAYMVAGLSLGPEGVTAGFFHLFTHAFFKALLFLGAGSVIHAVHSNNMSHMGGLKDEMPVTFWTFLIGSAALAGVFPLAGFWSKDELLVGAWEHNQWLFFVLLGVAVMTAFYMTRCVLLTFFGRYAGEGHPHESPAVMTGPLVGLAGASVVVGFLGAPQLGAVFGDWVYFEHPHDADFVFWVAILGTLAAAAGILGGYRLYRERRERDPLMAFPRAWNVLQHRYYIDDVYMRGVVYPIRDRASAGVNWTNQRVLDGAVNGAAWVARGLATFVSWIDRTFVDGVVNAVGGLTGATGGLLKYLQTGNVQWYAVLLFAGVVVLTIVFVQIA
jgi:NADH-quinone oxidoreductase subunit L